MGLRFPRNSQRRQAILAVHAASGYQCPVEKEKISLAAVRGLSRAHISRTLGITTDPGRSSAGTSALLVARLETRPLFSHRRYAIYGCFELGPATNRKVGFWPLVDGRVVARGRSQSKPFVSTWRPTRVHEVCRKKRIISAAALGPRGSLYEPARLPPNHAWPPPCTSQCSSTTRPAASR